ncbi:MAG: 23S rRNA (adenine(2030)-N(6))-methyltransferase RlmJ [Xanthomonadales bacterium]|nr:23S rRNA (adenine(2030)-N(6))-methyltransferase RlmJ [Xanthomonadales bacterium]
MNYRHRFHAGNFGDVLKHWALVELLSRLADLERPLAYLETHAGAGRYALGEGPGDPDEWRRGIGRLWEAREPALARYLELVSQDSPAGAGRPLAYPGSPLIAARLLGPRDRLLLCELEPEAHAALRALLADDARAAVHRRDGYEALGALLPPRERRGLVLIDPPYEARAGEFLRMMPALERAWRRFPQGCYAIWHPIKTLPPLNPFRRFLGERAPGPVLELRLLVRAPDSPLRLNGAGLFLVRPPWRLEERLAPGLARLAEALAEGAGAGASLGWLRAP